MAACRAESRGPAEGLLGLRPALAGAAAVAAALLVGAAPAALPASGAEPALGCAAGWLHQVFCSCFRCLTHTKKAFGSCTGRSGM